MCVSQWSLNCCVFVSFSAWALPFSVVFVSCSRSSLLRPLLFLCLASVWTVPHFLMGSLSLVVWSRAS